jgi:hypothetical protein
MTSLLELFCAVDAVCQGLPDQHTALPLHSGQRRRQAGLGESELMTLLIPFHQSR